MKNFLLPIAIALSTLSAPALAAARDDRAIVVNRISLAPETCTAGNEQYFYQLKPGGTFVIVLIRRNARGTITAEFTRDRSLRGPVTTLVAGLADCLE